MEDDLQKLPEMIDAVAGTLKPTERKKLSTELGRAIRDQQANNIRQQKQPDGAAFEARKPQKARREIKFIYRTSDGTRHLRSWRETEAYLIGFDRYRGAIRSFRKDRIIRTLKVDRGLVPSQFDRQRSDSRRKMFNKTRKSKWLKAKATANEVTIGFVGPADRVARVHHFGLRDKVSHKGPHVKYPERELLGANRETLAIVEDRTIAHLSKKL